MMRKIIHKIDDLVYRIHDEHVPKCCYRITTWLLTHTDEKVTCKRCLKIMEGR